MATPLTVISASSGGLSQLATVAADTAAGNTFANDGRTWLLVDGGTAGGTLTVKTNAILPTGLVVPDKVYTLTTGTQYLLDPSDFPLVVTGETVKVTGSVNTIKLAAFH